MTEAHRPEHIYATFGSNMVIQVKLVMCADPILSEA